MLSTSSQLKYWTFTEEKLEIYRYHANRKFIADHNKEKDHSYYLSPEEELHIVRHYENDLKAFYIKFPHKHEPLPNDVKGTALHFYKRFYLVSSVMDFHPKEMMFTCIYLSCKICEYRVPIDIFVKNIDGDPKLFKFIILDQEIELLYRLNFRINIHTPYRAIEGFIIDLKTRCKLCNPERLHDHISRFMSYMWNTDVCLMYSPALIALTTVMHAVTRCKENIDDLIQTLLDNPPKATVEGIRKVTHKIRATVLNVKAPSKEMFDQAERKLLKCRNPRNDPVSNEFKKEMLEFYLENALCKE